MKQIKIFYTLKSILMTCKKSLYGGTLKKELREYEPTANEYLTLKKEVTLSYRISIATALLALSMLILQLMRLIHVVKF